MKVDADLPLEEDASSAWAESLASLRRKKMLGRSPSATSIQILHIFISPGHNFFGHHGKPPADNPIFTRTRVHCVAGKGIEGDRFFNRSDGYKGQVTFFASEVFAELRQAFPPTTVSCPSALRRNVITAGLELSALIGQTFTLQGIIFEGTEECRPCHWMNDVVGPGAEAWLAGRGGLRARVLTSGFLRTTVAKRHRPA